MINVIIRIDTDKGKGHIEAQVKTEDAFNLLLESLNSLCKEKYEWYKITNIEKQAIDENDGTKHTLN